jgi:hypothetical protein
VVRVPHLAVVLGLCVALLVSLGTTAWAVQPSELLLPNTTKGFISTHDVEEMRAKFNATQLGEMIQDPVMEPFVDDLRRQARERLERAGRRLGVTLDDVDGVYGGEVALALIQPDPRDKMSHATALLVDVTGKQQQLNALLAKIDANQRAKRAVRSQRAAAGVNITIYTQPLAAGQRTPTVVCYFIKDDQLVASDDLNTAVQIAGRFGGNATDTLASVPAFRFTMDRNRQEAGDQRHHIRWFIEPFGYVEASRASSGVRRRRGTDMLAILQRQGFPAVRGVGGNVFFATADVEMLHRTYVYAPPVRRPAGAPAGEKYDLAMRMLDFPNSANVKHLDPQPWTLPDVATYLSFNWRMKEAFAYSETLVDAIAGDKGVFEEIWLSLKTDPHGPKIDIYGGLVNHLGTRATLLSDVKEPIDLKSERLLALIEVIDPATVAATVERAFREDPQARKHTFQGHTIWVISQDEELTGVDSPELLIEGAGFVSAAEVEVAQRPAPARPRPGDEALPNMAVTVYERHLVVSTHVDFIERLIAEADAGAGLGAAKDYQQVMLQLEKFGSANDSFRVFSRTDESYRATYELLRQNRLPQSETMLARILNAVTQNEEQEGRRQQQIDGSKLPPFEQVKKYLGPSGLYVQSEDNGWIVVGCLLRKGPPPPPEALGEPEGNASLSGEAPAADAETAAP